MNIIETLNSMYKSNQVLFIILHLNQNFGSQQQLTNKSRF